MAAVLVAVEYFLPRPLCLPPISNRRKLHLARGGWKWSPGAGDGGRGEAGRRSDRSQPAVCVRPAPTCVCKEMLGSRRSGTSCLWVLLLFLCLVQLMLF